MKTRFPLFLALVLATATVGSAQFDFGKLSKGLDTIKDVGKVAKGVTGIGPQQEKEIGESVSLEIIGKFGGLVRDEEMMNRVNIIGRTLARYSTRPDLDWRFGVLDSDTINAFSAPDGFVFITRGLYELAKSDDVLAGVIGHEIAHITRKHALNMVARGEFLSGAIGIASRQSGDVAKLNTQLKQFDLGLEKIVSTLFEKGFDPQSEFDADKVGHDLAVTVGYAPGGLRTMLVELQKHNGDSKKIFSTHPPLKDRLTRLPNDPLVEP